MNRMCSEIVRVSEMRARARDVGGSGSGMCDGGAATSEHVYAR
jgi:hypothetical protein